MCVLVFVFMYLHVHVSTCVYMRTEHKKKFREWRKKHYDEFHAVKRLRELKKVRNTARYM